MNYSEDWKERIEFLIPLFLKQIEDSHKGSEFLIGRGYNLLFLNAIFSFLIIQINHNFFVLSGLTILFFSSLVTLKDILLTHRHKNQGLKPSVVEINKTVEGFNLKEGYVIHKETSKSEFYAWIINCLDEQLQHSLHNTSILSSSYKKAQIISFIGIGCIISYVLFVAL
jgi:hypothetical protein